MKHFVCMSVGHTFLKPYILQLIHLTDIQIYKNLLNKKNINFLSKYIFKSRLC